jgi:hypothetical protein
MGSAGKKWWPLAKAVAAIVVAAAPLGIPALAAYALWRRWAAGRRARRTA